MANEVDHIVPHRGVLPVVTEHVWEHALGLVGVGQVHDDARPLFGEGVVGSWVNAVAFHGLFCEIKEGLAHGVLVAKVGKLAVEHGVVSVHTHLFFAVGKNTELAYRGFRQVPNHSVQEAFFEALARFLCELEHV